MDPERVRRLEADPEDRVQGRQGILRDERDVGAAEPPQVAVADSPRRSWPRRRIAPASTRPGSGRSRTMARPTVDFPAPDSPTSPSTSPASSARSTAHVASAGAVAHRQSLDVQHRRAHAAAAQATVRSRGSRRSRRPSPRRLKPDDGHDEGEHRNPHAPPAHHEVAAPLGDHRAPGRRRRLDPESHERQQRLDADGDGHLQRRQHDDQGHEIRAGAPPPSPGAGGARSRAPPRRTRARGAPGPRRGSPGRTGSSRRSRSPAPPSRARARGHP